METRKIQQVGGGTYTVSLPKEWATAADIEPGAVVALHSHIDGTLVVQTGVESESTPLCLRVDDAAPDAIERTLRAAYAAGIDRIELDAADGISEETRRRVERRTRTLTGVAVTDASDGALQIRSLLDAEEVSITQSVRQLQFAALSAHRAATTHLTAPTTEEPVGVDTQTDRIAAMVDHYFQRGLDSLSVMDALGLTRPELFVRWVTARELARVADHADRVATVAGRLEEPVDREFAAEFDDLAERGRDLVRDAVGVVLDTSDQRPSGGPTASPSGDDDAVADAAAARRCLDERDELCDALGTLDRRLFETDDADYRLTHAVDSLRRTAETAGHIADVGLGSLLQARCSSAPLAVGRPAPSSDSPNQ